MKVTWKFDMKPKHKIDNNPQSATAFDAFIFVSGLHKIYYSMKLLFTIYGL